MNSQYLCISETEVEKVFHKVISEQKQREDRDPAMGEGSLCGKDSKEAKGHSELSEAQSVHR